jgi:autotransporter passenger strand-loop-strand repeat protein
MSARGSAEASGCLRFGERHRGLRRLAGCLIRWHRHSHGGFQRRRAAVYGNAISATIFTGSQVVEVRGTASGTMVNGGLQYVIGGAAIGATVSSVGTQQIGASLGNVASLTTILSGGTEIVFR